MLSGKPVCRNARLSCSPKRLLNSDCHYTPQPISPTDLALMRRIDAPEHPFTGARMLRSAWDITPRMVCATEFSSDRLALLRAPSSSARQVMSKRS